MWLMAGTALAYDAPAVTVEADGTVVGVALVAASADAVRALLGDVEREASLSPMIRDVLVVGAEGRCAKVRKHTRGLLRPFELVALRCPTTTGWREALVESADFTEYATEWRVAPADAGTRVEYRVRAGLRLAFPAAAVRAGMVDATRTSLENLQESAR